MPARLIELSPALGLSLAATKLIQQTVRDGRLLIFPTDTIYGLGCDAFNERGINMIYEIKGRDPARPLSTHVKSLTDIEPYCHPLTERQSAWVRRLCPGPYTVVLRASQNAPRASISVDGKIGLRVPDSRSFRIVADAARAPLVGTSVNRSGQPPLTDVDHIISGFRDLVDLIIVTDETMGGQSSAVIDLTGSAPRALRGEVPSSLLTAS